MEPNTALVGTVCALIGVAAPIFGKFIVEFFKSSRYANLKAFESQQEQLRIERTRLDASLQQQIFDTRDQLIIVQRENIKVIQENAELRAQLLLIMEENKDLRARISELEAEVSQLRAQAGVQNDSTVTYRTAE